MNKLPSKTLPWHWPKSSNVAISGAKKITESSQKIRHFGRPKNDWIFVENVAISGAKKSLNLFKTSAISGGQKMTESSSKTLPFRGPKNHWIFSKIRHFGSQKITESSSKHHHIWRHQRINLRQKDLGLCFVNEKIWNLDVCVRNWNIKYTLIWLQRMFCVLYRSILWHFEKRRLLFSTFW